MLYGAILAGGSGSRLWPLSRELYPKQLLKLNTSNSLLQATFLRLASFIGSNNIFSITNIKHVSSIKMQLQEINKDACVISEPISKNTAPAIAFISQYLIHKDEEAVVLVVPSDHFIVNTEKFIKSVQEAEKLANMGYIVTLGINPSYPETGYGYIKGKADSNISLVSKDGLKVECFKEKPELDVAKRYIDEGGYFWNSGIFVFKAKVLLEAFAKFAPDIYEIIPSLKLDKNNLIDYKAFERMPSISIDYALMEKADNLAIVPLSSDWNDLGSWKSIYDINKKDENNNVIVGNVIEEDCKNSLIYSGSKMVSAVGVENLILVETSDAILACSQDKAQDVKKIFEKLKKEDNSVCLVHKTVYRPWGYYSCIEQGENYLIKIIQVSPHQKLSLQMHNHRSEHWVILEGCAKVILEDKEYILKPGESIDIAIKEKHSLQNPFEENLKIMEVQRGDYLSEDDIIRFEDIYGRV